MATVRYSDLGAIQNALGPKNTVDPVNWNAFVVSCQAIVTVGSGYVATDIVYLCKVPAGFRLLDCMSTVVSGGMGSGATATVDVGDTDTTQTVSSDADRYADGLDVAAAGIDLFTANSAAQRLTPVATGEECWITATLATWSSVTTGSKLVFNLFFAKA